MKREEFITELKKELEGLSLIDIEDIIRDQEEMINDALAAGRTEESILKSLGYPKDLAKSLKAEIKIDQAVCEKKLLKQTKGIFGAIGALLVLAPFNLIFILGPFLAVMCILLTGWLLSLAMGILAIVMIWAFFAGVIFVGYALTLQLTTIFTFIGFIGLAILFIIGMYYLTKFIFKLILSYLKWNFNFVMKQTQ